MNDIEKAGFRIPKTIAEVKAHPLVVDFSDERGTGDGIWAYLKAGWCISEVHSVHEDTVKELTSSFKSVRKCECDECLKMIANGRDMKSLAEQAVEAR